MGKRKRLTLAEKLALVRKYELGSTGLLEFCEREGVSKSSFCEWRRDKPILQQTVMMAAEQAAAGGGLQDGVDRPLLSNKNLDRSQKRFVYMECGDSAAPERPGRQNSLIVKSNLLKRLDQPLEAYMRAFQGDQPVHISIDTFQAQAKKSRDKILADHYTRLRPIRNEGERQALESFKAQLPWALMWLKRRNILYDESGTITTNNNNNGATAYKNTPTTPKAKSASAHQDEKTNGVGTANDSTQTLQQSSAGRGTLTSDATNAASLMDDNAMVSTSPSLEKWMDDHYANEGGGDNIMEEAEAQTKPPAVSIQTAIDSSFPTTNRSRIVVVGRGATTPATTPLLFSAHDEDVDGQDEGENLQHSNINLMEKANPSGIISGSTLDTSILTTNYQAEVISIAKSEAYARMVNLPRVVEYLSQARQEILKAVRMAAPKRRRRKRGRLLASPPPAATALVGQNAGNDQEQCQISNQGAQQQHEQHPKDIDSTDIEKQDDEAPSDLTEKNDNNGKLNVFRL